VRRKRRRKLAGIAVAFVAAVILVSLFMPIAALTAYLETRGDPVCAIGRLLWRAGRLIASSMTLPCDESPGGAGNLAGNPMMAAAWDVLGPIYLRNGSL